MIDSTENAGSRKTRLHLGGGIFFGLWAGFGWYGHLGNAQLGEDFGLDPGPGLLPAIVLSVLTLGALVLAGMGLVERVKSGGPLPIDWGAILRGSVAPALLCLSLAAYLPLVWAIGFVPATMLYSGLLMAALSRNQLRAAPGSALLSIVVGVLVCTSLTYALFIYWIGVPLR
ncbi:hypothetical protein MesoLjLc_32230 [Mesorhizobium sp. L-8-10]|uniref:tripartite tricarboxylate transporter TctB family protein n=1 Tax=Mesorhizobium sp. L-8-10 TaxID=2744523 RepID=UPI0019253EC7|nr:tripartite tricarboxylate transporter TctB family protein [Mesorhizobium sp. L-8-10]BCH31293.1 hypothetical protein MesoLjLc_32230 [Mesorhizobium sp. L-8-10]